MTVVTWRARFPTAIVAGVLLGLCAGASQPAVADATETDEALARSGGSPAAGPAATSRRWSAPVAVNDDGAGPDQRCPVIVSDTIGGLHTIWLDHRDGGFGPSLFGASLVSGTTRWSANERVVSGATQRLHECPALTIDSFGALHAVWQSFSDGDPDILHSARRPGDFGWSMPKRVNDEPGRFAQWSPRVAADGAGNVHVAWVDYRDGTADIRHRRRNADGTWRRSVRVNGEARGEQSEPELTVTPGGEIIAVWRDGRDGANQIFASRLPQFGDAWWPNAELSVSTGIADHRHPVVAASGRGGVDAVWIDAGTDPASLRTAALRLDDPDNPFWSADRLVYQPIRGAVLSASIAGGAGGQSMVAWSESRPNASRIYASPLRAGSLLSPERVDEGRAAQSGLRPRLTIDPAARAHVIWDGTSRTGDRDTFYAAAHLDRPVYAPTESQGWLHYVGRAPNCGGDAFVIVGCDGNVSLPVLARDLDLSQWAGKYVIVRGEAVADTACRHVAATDVVREIAPCEHAEGFVTGRLATNGSPVEGATVQLGDQRAHTGESGRFFFSNVPPDTYVITATGRCSLPARSEPVSVGADRVTVVPDGRLIRADATEDGVVDARDLVLVAAALRSPPSRRPFCSDLDGDNTVSVHDLSVVSTHYGRRAPEAWAGPVQAVDAARQLPEMAAISETYVNYMPIGGR